MKKSSRVMMSKKLAITAAVLVTASFSSLILAEKINTKKFKEAQAQHDGTVHTDATVTYIADLTNTNASFGIGTGIPGSTTGSLFDSATYDYYRFCAYAGDTVTIETHRTIACMDPAQSIYTRTTTDSAGVEHLNGGPNMGFVTFNDDSAGIPHGTGGEWGDPTSTFTTGAFPLFGEHTLAVYNYSSVCTGAGEYEIHVSGVSSCSLPLEIDIVPGDNANTINLCSKSDVPVTIFGDLDFDVLQIDLNTLRLADASAQLQGQSGNQVCNIDDTDGDGFDDLSCDFVTEELTLVLGDTEAELTGTLLDGTDLLGSDTVNVVRNKCKKKR